MKMEENVWDLGNVGAAEREDSDGAGGARVSEVDGPVDEVVAGGARRSEVDGPLGEAVAGGGSGAEESTKFWSVVESRMVSANQETQARES